MKIVGIERELIYLLRAKTPDVYVYVDSTVLGVKLSRTFYEGRWQRETFWAVHAGLLTPLTFTRHRLSPLAAFTSGAYFQSSQWKAVTVNSPALKACLKAHSQNVSGNKQERCSCCRMPKNAAFSPRLNLQSSGQPKTMQGHFYFRIFYHLSLVIFACATEMAFVLLHNSTFNFHCYTHRQPTPTQRSAQKWRQLRPFATSCAKY